MGRIRVWASLGAVVAALLTTATPAVAAPDIGGLTGAGCIAHTGDPPGCGATQAALETPRAAAVSPDGRSVYVASAYPGHAIVRFDRNTVTGALTPMGCIADPGKPNAATCGVTQEGLDNTGAITVSPDGRSVYAVSESDSSIVRFDRNTTTGALTPAGCVADAGSGIGCGAFQQGLNGAHGVAVSPDGSSVYVASFGDSAVARFTRDPATGALTPAGCVASNAGTCGAGNVVAGLMGASGIAVSPDGKSVYATGLADGAVVRLDRNTSTGALTSGGCFGDIGTTVCGGSTVQGLSGARSVTVSPDGKSVYVASESDEAIVRFDRNAATGAISGQGCIADVGDVAGCGATQQGLSSASSVSASLDGKSIYVVGWADAAIVRFDRNTASGALTPKGCISDVGDLGGCGVTQQGLGFVRGVVVSPDGRSVYALAEESAVVSFNRLPDTSNHTPLSIPAGPGDPNPSTILVAGLDAKISDVNVKLEGFGHGFPPDVDVLVEGPGGQRAMLMSDTGGFNPVGGLDLTFDDSASQQLLGTPTSGSYRPTNVDNGGDPFSTPYCNPGPSAPDPVANCLTQSFRGTNPNGIWRLYVSDTDPGSEGQLARGWSLDITTDATPPETTIDSGPSGTITSTSASFGFSSSEAGATFECSLDGGPYGSCTSPKGYASLTDGAHTFAVRASDSLLNTDATPATRAFSVDTSAPGNRCDEAKAALDKANAALAKAKKALKKAKASKNKTKIKKAKAKVKKAKAKVKSAKADVDAAC